MRFDFEDFERLDERLDFEDFARLDFEDFALWLEEEGVEDDDEDDDEDMEDDDDDDDDDDEEEDDDDDEEEDDDDDDEGNSVPATLCFLLTFAITSTKGVFLSMHDASVRFLKPSYLIRY